MIFSLLLPKNGPMWAEIAASILDKSLIGSALYTVGQWDEVKKIHDEYVNNNSKPSEPTTNSNSVVNVFNDVD